jgi:hypothetical protein
MGGVVTGRFAGGTSAHCNHDIAIRPALTACTDGSRFRMSSGEQRCRERRNHMQHNVSREVRRHRGFHALFPVQKSKGMPSTPFSSTTQTTITGVIAVIAAVPGKCPRPNNTMARTIEHHTPKSAAVPSFVFFIL